MPDPTVPGRPRRPHLLAAAATLAVLAAGALLVALLLVLIATRDTLGEQRDLSAKLLQRADPTFASVPPTAEAAVPVLRDAAPVLAQARKALPQTRRTAASTQALLADAVPLVTDLRTADLPGLTGSAGALVTDLRSADLPGLTDAAGAVVRDLRPAAGALRAADLPQLLDDLGGLASTGETALPRVTALLGEVRARALLRRASKAISKVGSILELQKAALRTNRETLQHTVEIEDMFRESLQIQRDVTDVARQINKKIPDVNPVDTRARAK